MMRGLVPATAILLALTVPAVAQDDGGTPAKRPTVSRNAAPSPNATINLINLLVKQGVLGEEQAAELIKQADDEAYVARQAVRNATDKADGAEKTAVKATEAVSPPGTKRVTYVPEIVKKQLREDIKREVMEKAEKENWASPGKYPEWAQRIRFYGDVRVRYEMDRYPKGNDQQSAVNFNAINTGNPYDVSDNVLYYWPTYNATENRERTRLRARLGMDADLFEGFSAGLRIATGDSNAPISFNQTLGGSGGNFSKYGIWLDRAFIRYSPSSDLILSAGRFDNPFFTTTDLIYHRELGFDGFAGQAKYEVMPGFSSFVVGGAFPIFNTDLNAGSNYDPIKQTTKFPSYDKWMFGAQIGSKIHVVPEVEFTVAAAYYDFTNVQGQLSSPCFANLVNDACDTDLTRPSFAQKGNSYMPLRTIIPLGLGESQYQYFGLASAFRNVVLSGRADLGYFHPVHIVFDGEYVNNVAWNKSEIADKFLAYYNNTIPLGPKVGCPPDQPVNCTPIYDGGNQGWLARMTVGYRELKQFGDWNAFVGYKWLESDAVIDAFADSDFGLGGTNLKGYFVGASVALGQNVWLSARWLSANQIAGAPYAVDVLQIDLNAKF